MTEALPVPSASLWAFQLLRPDDSQLRVERCLAEHHLIKTRDLGASWVRTLRPVLTLFHCACVPLPSPLPWDPQVHGSMRRQYFEQRTHTDVEYVRCVKMLAMRGPRS